MAQRLVDDEPLNHIAVLLSQKKQRGQYAKRQPLGEAQCTEPYPLCFTM